MWIAAGLIAALSTGCSAPPVALASAPESSDTVTRVIDGDTIELASGDIVRVRGIDTPEVHGKRECGGPEASAFARQVLDGQRVRLVTDPDDLRDRYGRLVAEVHLENGSYAVAVTRAGWAEAYTFKRAHPATDRMAIEAAQNEAQATQRGMWSLCGRPQ